MTERTTADGVMTFIEAMRKIYLYLSIVAALAASCAVREETETLDPADRSVLFVAQMQTNETRTAFGPGEDGIYHTNWTARDTAVAVSLNHAEPREARVVSGPDYSYAHFQYSTGVQASSYTFHLLTPSSAAEQMNASRGAWQIRIPSIQTPSQDSPDEAAQILSATTGTLSQIPSKLGVRFSHVTAYGRLTLLNLPEGLTVQSVTLSCSTPLTGSWYLQAGEAGQTPTLEPKEASSTLVIQTDRTENIWFACAPGDVSGATLNIIVCTDRGTYEKSVTLKNNRSFKPGRVASFSVDFTGIVPPSSGGTFVLVTDASTLRAGDEIVLLDKDGTRAVSTTQNANNRGTVAVSTHNGILNNPASTVQHFVLRGSAGAWNILTSPGNQYLYAQEDGNYLRTSSTATGLYNWTISIATDGTATISAPYTNGNSTRTILYNHKNDKNLFFSAFTSTTGTNMDLMSIYRKEAIYDNPYETDSILSQDEYGAYRNGNNRIYDPDMDQLSREYTVSSHKLCFAILTPSTGTILQMDGIKTPPLMGDSFTLQCKEFQGLFTNWSGNYSVKVLRVDGPKVWLSDGEGNGFIIKQ